MADDLFEKLRGAKKKIIQGANEVMSSEDTKEAGKVITEYGAGIKGVLVKKGGKFLKKYVNEKMTTENPTGATVGAFGEYVLKQVGSEVKKGVNTLQKYLEKETHRYHKLEVVPELEIVKGVIEGYAQDSKEQGREEIKYKGVEFIIDKTEKELYVNLKNKGKAVGLTYFLEGASVPVLSEELNRLTDDLLKRLNRLLDPSVSGLEKTTSLRLARGEKEISYTVQSKKTDNMLEVNYNPEKRRAAVMLNYKSKIEEPNETQEEKKNERRKTSRLQKNNRRSDRGFRKDSK